MRENTWGEGTPQDPDVKDEHKNEHAHGHGHSEDHAADYAALLTVEDDELVDVSAGERPQIRLPNTYTSFNITNHAVFENIEFTGEDLFAEAKLDGAHMGYMGE